jgi:NAD(P)-dependent dehydrogenase (short-subunit alcohol dehydrogenase family)|tara:strand:+ start:1626 stop:2420 length:795 start_codon:yes stop_codon:yes gene_type:complete
MSNIFDNSIKGKVVLITGASGYIGRNTAHALSNYGANLILVDTNQKKLKDLKISIESNNSSVDIICKDLTKKGSIELIKKMIEKKYKKLDILINSIGFVGTSKMKGWNTNFKNQSKPAWDCSIETNMTSIFFLIQALHVLMKKPKSASIVNISSMYGEYAPDKNIYKGTKINNPAAYSVAKAGLNHMTKWLAVELGPKIRVNAISPGGLFRNQERMFVKKYTEKTLLKRMATEDDIIGPIIFFASDMSKYITGQNLIVDGGWGT